MRETKVWLSALCIALFSITAFSAGCGSGDPGSEDNDWDIDAGVDDTGVDDVGPDDAGQNDVDDVGPTEDADDAGADADADTETDVEIPDDAPEAMEDYLVCEFDLDCPINGSSCVTELSFNRTDAEGVDSVDVADIFDDVESGQGVCAEDCGTDPTICDTVFWSDPGGQAHPSSCQLVATGAEPYQVDPDDPSEIEVDYDEMLDGQAFAAICLPPFDRAQGRSESFCASCSAQDDCGEEASCYNALTEELVDEPGELGQSYCVEPCDGHDDCPMGFDCWELGEEGDSDEAFCIPIEDTCTDCVDRDEDGYGTGHCGTSDERQTPFDCDDRNPDAYFEADEDGQPAAHPFPDFCYDDPDDERYYNDLNCSGVLDHLEQIGAEQFPEEHCASCGDECFGLVDPDDADAGVYTCMTDGDDQPFCGAGCGTTQGELQDYDPADPEVLGRATCGDTPTECDIDLTEEYLMGAPEGSGVPDYRDPDTAPVSDYIWYEATEDGWATSDATPHFFCSAQEAEEELENPTQRRSCHPDEAGAQPGSEQLCDDIDWNCSGHTGPEDDDTVGEVDGDTYTVGQDCDVPGAYGECKPGVALCADGADGPEMLCESTATDYPVSTPACPVDDGSGDYDSIDTTCDGTPDYQSDTFDADGISIELVDEHGDVIDDNPDTVEVGAPCQVPGMYGKCRIGEVRCDGGQGLHCGLTTHPELEEPGFDGVDRSCDGSERYNNDDGQPHVIFVRDADDDFGFADNETNDLVEAIDMAKDCADDLTVAGEEIPCDIYMQAEDGFTVDETIVLEAGVHIYGGFDSGSWDPSDPATFDPPSYNTHSASTTVTVDAVPGLLAEDIDETTHFFGVEVVTEDLDDAAPCTPGLDDQGVNVGGICRSCDELYLQQVEIVAGASAPGADGSSGSDASNHGQSGEAGYFDAFSETVFSGGDGAHQGGDTGYFRNEDGSWIPQLVEGEDGQPGGSHGGSGGTGDSRDGSDGADGIATPPADPVGWNTLSWVAASTQIHASCPRPSVELQETSHGGGGGGSASIASDGTEAAVAGAGGGEGGEPGQGGAAGAPSIGMVLVDNNEGLDSQFSQVRFEGGQGGTGGDGGSGGDGTHGWISSSLPIAGETIRGGSGGDGAGGPGGTGGDGGISIGLLRINSVFGSDHGDILTVAAGGSGGSGGSGGEPRGVFDDSDADDGEMGRSGESGLSCDEFSTSDQEFSLGHIDVADGDSDIDHCE